MTRQQRRALQRQLEKKKPDEIVDICETMLDNGIREAARSGYDRGYQDGWRNGFADRGTKVVEAYHNATMLSLHTLFRFGAERCIRVIKENETNVVKFLTDEELRQEVQRQLKIEICMGEAIDRAQPM